MKRLATAVVGMLCLVTDARADEKSVIVAEYQQVCHQTIAPALMVPTIPKFNTSDYSHWQRNDGDLVNIFQTVLSRYRGSWVFDKNGALYLVHGKRVRIPASATLRIASAWRNPRRNVQVGSVVGCTSKHLLGRALDLVPEGTTGEVEDGSSTSLSTIDHLFPTLWNAARLSGFAIAEAGSVPVPCGTFENHVHIHRQ